MDSLKMPNSLSCLRVQRNQAICEEIVAQPIGAVEIKCSGARRNVNNSTLRIKGHPSPIVGGAAGLPRILRPSGIPEFSGTRDRVKRPAKSAVSNVEGTNVAGWCRESFGIATADDHKIFVNDRGAR